MRSVITVNTATAVDPPICVRVPGLGPDAQGDDVRWAAVLRRDHRADGEFYYAVRTTGIYCRPSCASRPARRENVRFFAKQEQAEAAGFRACKRCRPDQKSAQLQRVAMVTRACQLIESTRESIGLEALAQAAGMSRYHFHRVFKSVTGLTPGAYGAAHRQQRVRAALAAPGTVTDAIYGAGFNSSGRFYAAAVKELGMTPTQFRRGGAHAVIRFAVGECSLGSIAVAATDKGVCAILLGNDPDELVRDLQDRFRHATLVGADAEFERLVARVVALVEAPTVGMDLQLDVRGTAFQRRVWQALRDIPAGLTASYGDIARQLGAPKSARAVAGACAANPLAVVIPCHRVVRTDGSLSGYRWGIERKRALLDRERKA